MPDTAQSPVTADTAFEEGRKAGLNGDQCLTLAEWVDTHGLNAEWVDNRLRVADLYRFYRAGRSDALTDARGSG